MPVRMLVTPLLLALALLWPVAAATQSMALAWKDVEAIRVAAEEAPPGAPFPGAFASGDMPLWLAPDGRFAFQMPRFDDASPGDGSSVRQPTAAAMFDASRKESPLENENPPT